MSLLNPPDERRILIARVMMLAAWLLAAMALVIYVVEGEASRLVDDWVVHNVLATALFAGVVWLAIPGQPRNGALWTLAWSVTAGSLTAFGAALALAVTGIASGDVDSGALTVAPSELEVAGAVGFLLAKTLWVPSLFLVVTLGLLLFPDGRLPSPRWRWVGWLAVAAIAYVVAVFAWLTRPWSDRPYPTADMSGGELYSFGFPFLLLAVASSVASLVLRFRHSTGDTRQQFRWITFGFALLGLATVVFLPLDPDLFKIVSLPPIALLGAAYGVAISKYRLYEIDVVINRSLVLAVLAAFITGVYAVIVVGLGEWIGAGTSSLGLSIVATAVVAVAFEPVRHRVQRFANRIVYGARATPYQVLADLTARLSRVESMDGLLERIVQRLAEGTGAARATLRLEGSDEPAAAWPPGESGSVMDGEFTAPIVGNGRQLGRLTVAKPRAEALTPTEQALVEDLAGSAAMVLNRARLDADLAARAEDLRVSRRRVLDAQDDQRRRLERELHDGAQQQIVALKVKLGLAGRFAEQEGAEGAAKLIGQMATDAQLAIDEIRSLAKGIFPPLLENEGLAAALSGGAANAPIPVIVDSSSLGRFSPDVEAAAYFCITEAITNAVKHSQATRIDVMLDADGAGLRFSVRDDGGGFEVGEFSEGSGLVGMRDRLEATGGSLSVASTPGRGTTVEGLVPGRLLSGVVDAPA